MVASLCCRFHFFVILLGVLCVASKNHSFSDKSRLFLNVLVPFQNNLREADEVAQKHSLAALTETWDQFPASTRQLPQLSAASGPVYLTPFMQTKLQCTLKRKRRKGGRIDRHEGRKRQNITLERFFFFKIFF